MIAADEHIPVLLQHPNADETFISTSQNRDRRDVIPLEKLSIPRFGGDPKQYTSFRNLFDIAVHNNTNLPPVLKFSYLKSYLEGEPLALISNLMLSDDNYTLALTVLDKRYANRRIIAQSHLNQLWTMPKAMFGDAKSIRQMLNTITESVGALANQNYSVDQWDPILLHLFELKLDSQLRAQWELIVDTADNPSMNNFTMFLSKFCNAAIAGQSGKEQEKPNKKPYGKTVTLHAGKPDPRENRRQFTCQVCNTTPGHLLIACTVFKEKTPKDRYQIIKDLRRCFLCFSEHPVNQCKHTRVCLKCKGRHHSLLHFENTPDVQPTAIVNTPEPQPTTTVNSMFSSDKRVNSCVLMSTMAVLVQDSSGQYQEARALLDSGSQSSFLTEHCRNRLGVTRDKCSVAVQAMAGLQIPPIKARTQIIIKPVRRDTPLFTVETFILPRITGLIPSERVVKTEWAHVQGLDLADPRYDEPLPIDILLGADVFPYIISRDRREGTVNQPVALKTVFGWVLMGRSAPNPSNSTTSLFTSIDPIDQILRKFWEIEELPTVEKTSPAEQKCEEIYRTTTTRQKDGRYIVHLPFIHDPPPIGESYHLAHTRLIHLESRLSKSTDHRQDYNGAMQDYLDSGHMSYVGNTEGIDNTSFYIPHNGVVKPGSTTTKLRVVYDASALSSNGKSLNDNLFMGPKLQQDLPGIILRFRLHAVVFTTDIKQMFRQIVVTPKHRPYQRLLFRFQPSDPVQTYEMSTVTFGQRSSPFLAIRTIHQLAEDEAKAYPNVQKVIYQDLYVDDVVTGADSEEEALKLQQEVIKVFERGKFELRKWSSNAPALLEAVPIEHRKTDNFTFDEPQSDYTKVLGLKWEPNLDMLSYQYRPNPVRFTKRAILSEIARIYDPIGLLTPVITNLKRLMKYLWSIGVGWDERIPDDAIDAWTRYHEELPLIGSIRIRRRATTPGATYEIHGFYDSSENAYAAAVHLLAREPNGISHCQLLMGKSKVAPEKRLSIPRLELCGALLLARCLEHIGTNLNAIPIEATTAWSDSTVVLAWIQTPTAKLKTFVANRVAKIQHMTSPKIWRHVPTAHNPADCASRGVTPKELVDHQIWWGGSVFLTQPTNTWPPVTPITCLDKMEHQVEEKQLALLITKPVEECQLLYASAELPKVLRLTAYWLRIRRNLSHQPISFDHS
ncbi:uncharacterized protein LOC132932813 [Metopolophium dirhodum]|uniref:uncharacterized protein LOC132932813 n=1 Tax=Metopolophium dirhodum TaxID=44670 RepID=UPI0029900E30|nr:uncharacterized protein LOC132932813 [Metopolophium dirhodum]